MIEEKKYMAKFFKRLLRKFGLLREQKAAKELVKPELPEFIQAVPSYIQMVTIQTPDIEGIARKLKKYCRFKEVPGVEGQVWLKATDGNFVIRLFEGEEAIRVSVVSSRSKQIAKHLEADGEDYDPEYLVAQDVFEIGVPLTDLISVAFSTNQAVNRSRPSSRET